MSVNIKSADLCNRCSYAFYRHCSEKMQGNCVGCVMYGTGNPRRCMCSAIKVNTPCPYFVEDESDG